MVSPSSEKSLEAQLVVGSLGLYAKFIVYANKSFPLVLPLLHAFLAFTRFLILFLVNVFLIGGFMLDRLAQN